jgi:DNA-binding NtrC family response regulator
MQLEKVRVLIVDDDPSIVKMLGRFVQDLSLEAIETSHPGEALRMASEQEIHIAVIDLHMPEMEGIELMKSLQRVNPGVAVILISGDHYLDSISEAIRGGAYDFLWKPLDFRQLTDSLRALREHILSRIER